MDGDVALYFDPVNDWAVANPDAAAARLPVGFGNPDLRLIRVVIRC